MVICYMYDDLVHQACSYMHRNTAPIANQNARSSHTNADDCNILQHKRGTYDLREDFSSRLNIKDRNLKILHKMKLTYYGGFALLIFFFVLISIGESTSKCRIYHILFIVGI